MRKGLYEILGQDKFIIGGVHLLALPGSTGYDDAGGMTKIIDTAIEDALKVQKGGVDGILFANESDMPYLQSYGPEMVTGYARVVAEVVRYLDIPFGINVLTDPVAAMAIANATGGQFVRGYFTGTYVGDMPLMDSRGTEAIRLRHNLRADHICIIANANCGIGVSIDTRDIGTRIRGAIMHTRIDAVSVSGAAAGFEARYSEVEDAVKAAGELPVVIGTGSNKDNIGKFLEIANGAIVATALREGGKTLARVDSARVEEFMKAVDVARGKTK